MVGSGSGFIRGVAVFPGGDVVVAQLDQMIRVIDPTKGKLVREFEPRPLGQTFETLWYSRQGLVIGCGEVDVCVWDARTGKLTNRYNARDVLRVASRPAMDLSPDGQKLVMIDKDHFIRVLNAKRLDLIGSMPDETKKFNRIKFCPDGLHLLCWDSNSMVFYLLDPIDGATQPYFGHQGNVNDVAFFPDEPLMASASGDRTVLVWDERTAQPKYRFEYPAGVLQIAVSPDGKFVVVALEKELIFHSVEITLRFSETLTPKVAGVSPPI